MTAYTPLHRGLPNAHDRVVNAFSWCPVCSYRPRHKRRTLAVVA